MGSCVTLLGYFVTLLLCLSFSAGRYLENRSPFSPVKRTSPRRGLRPRLFFKENVGLPKITMVFDQSARLTCQAGGSPPPTIHWVRNEHRIEQGDKFSNTNDEAFYEDVIDKHGRPLLRRSFTKSVLYLDCVTPEMEGEYTCVAETPTQRISSTTSLIIADEVRENGDETCLVKRTFSEKVPARIYLWTSNRIENRGANVQLFCRAEGYPKAKVMWLTPNNKVISEEDSGYELLSNGDLLIRNIQWKHMGSFSCVADNESGTDRIATFVYPAK